MVPGTHIELVKFLLRKLIHLNKDRLEIQLSFLELKVTIDDMFTLNAYPFSQLQNRMEPWALQLAELVCERTKKTREKLLPECRNLLIAVFPVALVTSETLLDFNITGLRKIVDLKSNTST